MKDFGILAWGLVAASVCTSLPISKATARLNRDLPTGISSPWKKSRDKTFANGMAHPSPCENSPDTHKHYLLTC